MKKPNKKEEMRHVLVTPQTHAELLPMTIQGGKRRSFDEVIQELLKRKRS